MQTAAVLFRSPQTLSVARAALVPPGENDLVVAVEWSGISTGTERLLWTGDMPPFPGLGYPLVPGYESVGRVIAAADAHADRVGQRVFVPGSRCFAEARSLFGGAAAQLVVPAAKARTVPEDLGADATLLALAATAQHAIADHPLPELVVGHGVLGRLVARLVLAAGGPAPVVWERTPARRGGALDYPVIDPADDDRHDYRTILDASGDAGVLDTLVSRLAPGGEIVLAGFYKDPLQFAFPPAFMREARLRVAAEWREPDFHAVQDLVATGRLSLASLRSHQASAADAAHAYATAFGDPDCLKMILDWTSLS
jgi:bacteriochlorophyllide a dehydrogenase